MKRLRVRAAAMLAGLWAGVLLCIGFMATPSAFVVLASVDAGRVAGRLLSQEAYLSLALAVLLFVIERGRSRHAAATGVGSVLSANIILLLGTLSVPGERPWAEPGRPPGSAQAPPAARFDRGRPQS